MTAPFNPFETPAASLDVPLDLTSEAERVRREHLPIESRIRSLGSLYILGGALAGVPMLIFGFTTALSSIGGGLLPAAHEVGVLLGMGAFWAGLFFMGLHLRRLRAWARWAAVALCSVGLLAVPMGTLVSGYFLYVLLSAKGATVFTPAYQEVIRQTPHVRLRTSPLAWAVLALLLVALAVVLVVELWG